MAFSRTIVESFIWNIQPRYDNFLLCWAKVETQLGEVKRGDSVSFYNINSDVSANVDTQGRLTHIMREVISRWSVVLLQISHCPCHDKGKTAKIWFVFYSLHSKMKDIMPSGPQFWTKNCFNFWIRLTHYPYHFQNFTQFWPKFEENLTKLNRNVWILQKNF